MKRVSDNWDFGVTRARARFITQAVHLEERDAPGLVRSGIVFTVLLLSGLLVLAWGTEIAEAARAPGRVVPSGLIQKIQHLEGGIVRSIEVRNGDRVEAGEPLVSLLAETTMSELRQLETRHERTRLELERVVALLEDRTPDFSSDADFERLAARQNRLFADQLASHRDQDELADALIRQREIEVVGLQGQIEAIEDELVLLDELTQMQRDMAQSRVLSRADLLNSQVRMLNTRRELRQLQGNRRVAEQSLVEARQQRTEQRSRRREALSSEAGELTAELAEARQAVVRAKDQLERLTVRAPVSGIITGLAVNTLNEVVQPGQVLMELVPVERELVVEAQISTLDVGHVQPGQKVDVKVSSYESTRFGSVPGALRRISASTYLDDSGQPYYLAEVALERDYLGNDPERNRIIPGMTVQADVLTGHRTLMEYMLKPVYRGFQTAFMER